LTQLPNYVLSAENSNVVGTWLIRQPETESGQCARGRGSSTFALGSVGFHETEWGTGKICRSYITFKCAVFDI